MVDLSTLALFSVAALALTMSPGPDMLLIASRSASQGKVSGFATFPAVPATTSAVVGATSISADHTRRLSPRIICERVYFDAGTILRQLGLASDPTSLRGKIETAVTHPVTVASALVRNAVRRGE